MPFKSGIQSCYRELWTDPNIKIRCGECQACKDLKTSNDVMAAHVPGKFCKKGNVCSYCSMVKYLTRCIRHVCGCECGRKCELCNGPEWRAEEFEKLLNHHFQHLYFLMLPRSKKKTFRYKRGFGIGI